jgi:toxin ParE1/3/4
VKRKPVVLRKQAEQDIDHAVEHYTGEGGAALALRFINALEVAFRLVANRPQAGSPRYETELNLPGLRVWTVHRFPYLVFYVDSLDGIDVWRVLHGTQEIPPLLQAGAG